MLTSGQKYGTLGRDFGRPEKREVICGKKLLARNYLCRRLTRKRTAGMLAVTKLTGMTVTGRKDKGQYRKPYGTNKKRKKMGKVKSSNTLY